MKPSSSRKELAKNDPYEADDDVGVDEGADGHAVMQVTVVMMIQTGMTQGFCDDYAIQL